MDKRDSEIADLRAKLVETEETLSQTRHMTLTRVKELCLQRDAAQAKLEAAEARIRELELCLSTRHRYNELEKARTQLAAAETRAEKAEEFLEEALEMNWDDEGSQRLTYEACDLLKRIRDHRYSQARAEDQEHWLEPRGCALPGSCAAVETITELRAKIGTWIDMTANCASVPQNPDSLPQMLLHEFRAALAKDQPATQQVIS